MDSILLPRTGNRIVSNGLFFICNCFQLWPENPTYQVYIPGYNPTLLRTTTASIQQQQQQHRAGSISPNTLNTIMASGDNRILYAGKFSGTVRHFFTRTFMLSSFNCTVNQTKTDSLSLQSFNFQWLLTTVPWKNGPNAIPWPTPPPLLVSTVENPRRPVTSWWCRWAKNRFVPTWKQTNIQTK